MFQKIATLLALVGYTVKSEENGKKFEMTEEHVNALIAAVQERDTLKVDAKALTDAKQAAEGAMKIAQDAKKVAEDATKAAEDAKKFAEDAKTKAEADLAAEKTAHAATTKKLEKHEPVSTTPEKEGEAGSAAPKAAEPWNDPNLPWNKSADTMRKRPAAKTKTTN